MCVSKGVYTVKKGQPFSCPQPGCHWANSSWLGIIKLFLARQSLFSDIPAGDGKMADLFLQSSIYRIPDFLCCYMIWVERLSGGTGSHFAHERGWRDPNHTATQRLWYSLYNTYFTLLFYCHFID
jgi:hypothetical protein